MSRRAWGSVWASALVAGVLITAAVVAGWRMPTEASLQGFPPRAALDYDASFRSSVAPLRDEYVREILGPAEAEAAAAARAPVASSRDGSSYREPDPFALPRADDAHPFVNDDLRDARPIRTIPFTGRTDATGATRESTEPAGCATDGVTAWYRYDANSYDALVANTFGTSAPLALGVFERTPSTLKLIGCDSDLAGNALVQIEGERGRTYLFQIAMRPAGNRLVFNLEPGGVTNLVSSTPSGEPADGQSLNPSISADGRFVAFESLAHLTPEVPDSGCVLGGGPQPAPVAAALVPCFQTYVVDRRTGSIRMVSVAPDGSSGGGTSRLASMSGNGRFVAFVSDAGNLVAGEEPDGADAVYVRDLVLGRTERVSVSSKDADPSLGPQEGDVSAATISDDGRLVAFTSTAALVRDDTNNAPDVFVRDRWSGTTERVSVSSNEDQAVAGAEPLTAGGGAHSLASPTISATGRFVAFVSTAKNLVGDDDTNDKADLFVRDRVRGTTEIVSIASSGKQGSEHVGPGKGISADGRYVTFESSSPELVGGDDNGAADVFVRDRWQRTTFLASVSSSGVKADSASYDPTISRNGRSVAFSSNATTLVAGSRVSASTCDDAYLVTSCPDDLYVHDLMTRTTVRIPVAPSAETQGSARNPSISGDGSTIAFYSGCLDCNPPAQVWAHDRRRRRT